MTERVLIVDFGSQVTQLIARRVRESGVYCEIHPFHPDQIPSVRDVVGHKASSPRGGSSTASG